MTHVSEQWMDGFVSAVKSAGYAESSVPRILKIARLSESRRCNPDVFDAEFEKQAGLGSWLMNIAIALGLGWGGYQMLKKMYDRYINTPTPTTQKATSLGDVYPNTFGPASNPFSDTHSGGANPFLGNYKIDHTPVAPAQSTYVEADILESPAARSPVNVFDPNGRQIANTDRRVPPMLDPAKPGNMYKYMAQAPTKSEPNN